jgi:uncharacterized protein (TIGR03118 family)
MSSNFIWPTKKGASRPQHREQFLVERLEDRFLLSGGFTRVNLVSDIPGQARVTDPNLVNPWGMAFSPTGPFWLADNGSGFSTILDGRGSRFEPVAVTSAGRWPSRPTGAVFNAGNGFLISGHGVTAPSRFLFASEDGTITAWTTVVDPSHALVVVDNSLSGAAYTGLALADDASGSGFLYAADFSHGTIAVFDQNFTPVVRASAFQDPNLPDGLSPFNIQNVRNALFVTYARVDGEEAAESGGVVDIFNPDGSFVRRFASEGALSAPWGLALAPAGFGSFGGALLVANEGDGHINAYDPDSAIFLGELQDSGGVPITIPDVWTLVFGNGHAGGDSNTLFFSAGLDDEHHGLFGAIQPPQLRGADTAGIAAFDPHAPGEPGDYPLPPSAGPALRHMNDGGRQATAVLLPSRQSSLNLFPTLSGAPPLTARIRLSDSPVTSSSVAIPLAGHSETIRRLGSRRIAAADNLPCDNNRCLALCELLDLSTEPFSIAKTMGLPLEQAVQPPNISGQSDQPPQADASETEAELTISDAAKQDAVDRTSHLTWGTLLNTLLAAAGFVGIYATRRGPRELSGIANLGVRSGRRASKSTSNYWTDGQ